jgi:RNA polymerase sigma factor (sigma-70 family)
MSRSGVARQIQTLFEGGTVTGLTDGQLLERFAARRGQEAEPAFAALVARHGPMVLSVCRGLLGNSHDAEDAFQATFLVLAHKAGTLRRPDLLGPWLHGVAHHTARRLKDKNVRRLRHEAEAAMAGPGPSGEGGADRLATREEIEALHEEVERLPERYRVAVVLCDLQGLTHEEAARRLGRPVGTISARVSRARERLRSRLTRRGLALPAGVIASAMATNSASAMPVALTASTIKVAMMTTASAGLAAGTVPATVATLARGVLGSMTLVNLKLILTAFFVAGAVAAGGTAFVRQSREAPRAEAQIASPKPVKVASTPSAAAKPRPADAIVQEIEKELKNSRRPLMNDEFFRVHSAIADLVDELRTAYPDDPRVAKHLPDRWSALSYLRRRGEARAEVEATLVTTKDASLRVAALHLRFWLSHDPGVAVESSTYVAEAEAFARAAPGDNRVALILYKAAATLDEAWYVRVGFAVMLIIFGALTLATAWMPRISKATCRKIGLGLGLSGVLAIMASAFAFQFLGEAARMGLVSSVLGMLNQVSERFRRVEPFVAHVLHRIISTILAEIRTTRAGLAVALAAVVAPIVVHLRMRHAPTPMWRPRILREGISAFVAVLAVLCLVDAGRISYQRSAIRRRIVRDYPDASYAHIIQGEDRQSSSNGQPFELEFDDAISGRHISMKHLRGKIVVVDFWATWCGPCVGEIPELKRLYAKYHNKGVEFIGISRDVPEEDGGLKALKSFVAEREIRWPQFYQPEDNGDVIRTGAATNDFAESWGITLIPTVFIVDTEGNLYSTNARGKLDTLIPKLLQK